MPNPTLTNYHTEVPSRFVDPRGPGGMVLVGVVHGHPRHPDGETIMTAPVSWHAAKGRDVPTDSGTVYRLLEPDPKWVAWLAEQNIPFDPDNPIRLVTREEIEARKLGEQ